MLKNLFHIAVVVVRLIHLGSPFLMDKLLSRLDEFLVAWLCSLWLSVVERNASLTSHSDKTGSFVEIDFTLTSINLLVSHLACGPIFTAFSVYSAHAQAA